MNEHRIRVDVPLSRLIRQHKEQLLDFTAMDDKLVIQWVTWFADTRMHSFVCGVRCTKRREKS